MDNRTFIGVSGWSYDELATTLYAGVPRARWLEAYARAFGAVEVNGTFYRSQRANTFRAWRRRTPDTFVFTMKGHRYITHRKRLADPDPSIRRERALARHLGDKLACVCWQLPRTLRLDRPRLEAFLACLERRWPETRHAIEPRHPSWFDEDVAALLRDAGVAVVLSDAADWPMWDVVTTDLVYVRLHGHTRTYASRYAYKSLEQWCARIRRWRRSGHCVHVYFDNTAMGAAYRDAQALVALCS